MGPDQAFVDLHCHTAASFDSLAAPASVVRAAAARSVPSGALVVLLCYVNYRMCGFFMPGAGYYLISDQQEVFALAPQIGALGLRVERGVTYHGIALNVTVDLADFRLIDACGMPGVISTSIAAELGDPTAAPTTESVEHAARIFAPAFADALGATLEGS